MLAFSLAYKQAAFDVHLVELKRHKTISPKLGSLQSINLTTFSSHSDAERNYYCLYMLLGWWSINHQQGWIIYVRASPLRNLEELVQKWKLSAGTSAAVL